MSVFGHLPMKNTTRALAAGLVVLLVLFTPVSLDAWGVEVHRWITQRAIAGLPEPLKSYYGARSAMIVEHSIDPDMWRVVGLRGDRGDEDPNHFLDIDGLDEPRPFTGVPREWDAYVARYGAERANKIGRLPWRAEEIYRLLVSRFQDAAKNPQGYGLDNAVYLSAVLAHYVEDAHQPFHGVANYDGQLTNQRGIHARFETEVVLRNRAAMSRTLRPVTIRPIPEFKAFVFDRLVEDEALVPAILDADRAATTGREFYDDLYYAALFKATRPVIERRLSEAASGVASVIVAAWTEGGKPALPLTRVSTPVRIRR
jgi:hypothetical protein